ncbi:hypothetical protein K493DRAFT_342873 [Basidiobolus meristosporus CBS 931.73]|uniref:Uncharacterized protein n=1 Tax=Basidiobolus meristosporus CBS 931.73 TaxID=1314790 RepID=A0A1Y1WWD2_9FUNG|nr:hypothetical protein K493DRAFT_342873 [Basidiobolus meristosporus CBS 931.73]|eukprot:ORX77869.1 hypothetical protein K493DRAFT_342873 [Basidiobolus meristosporus CBS 931.73]
MQWNPNMEHLTNYGEQNKIEKGTGVALGFPAPRSGGILRPSQIQIQVTPREYIKRLVDECWQSIFLIGQMDSKTSRKQGLWFLRQFCVIYGFSSIQLELRNILMLEQLLQVSLIEELKSILPKNRDTITELLKYHHQQHSHTADSGVDEGTEEECDLERVHWTPEDTELFKTLNFLNEEYHIAAKPREERFFMRLMDHITRITTRTFPVEVFAQTIRILPEISKDEIDVESQLEILGCIDYLLLRGTNDPVFGSVPVKSWFRESPSRNDMSKIKDTGIRGFLEQYKSSGIDPRLIAAYLKHQINESKVSLIPIEFVDMLSELVPEANEDKKCKWRSEPRADLPEF